MLAMAFVVVTGGFPRAVVRAGAGACRGASPGRRPALPPAAPSRPAVGIAEPRRARRGKDPATHLGRWKADALTALLRAERLEGFAVGWPPRTATLKPIGHPAPSRPVARASADGPRLAPSKVASDDAASWVGSVRPSSSATSAVAAPRTFGGGAPMMRGAPMDGARRGQSRRLARPRAGPWRPDQTPLPIGPARCRHHRDQRSGSPVSLAPPMAPDARRAGVGFVTAYRVWRHVGRAASSSRRRSCTLARTEPAPERLSPPRKAATSRRMTGRSVTHRAAHLREEVGPCRSAER